MLKVASKEAQKGLSLTQKSGITDNREICNNLEISSFDFRKQLLVTKHRG